MNIEDFFGKLLGVFDKVNIQLEVNGSPAPGTWQHAAKSGGAAGLFRWLSQNQLQNLAQESGQANPAAPADPWSDLVRVVSEAIPAGAKEKIDAATSQSQGTTNKLIEAGGKGLESFVGMLAKLIPGEGKGDAAPESSPAPSENQPIEQLPEPPTVDEPGYSNSDSDEPTSEADGAGSADDASSPGGPGLSIV